MKVIELKINDADLAGWNGLALVEIPAIEENFMAFGKQDAPKITDEYILEQLLCVEFSDKITKSHNPANDERYVLTPNKFSQELAEKQMFITPIMRADFKIPRVTEDGEKYEVFFSANTIKQIAYKAMKEQKVHQMNIEHDKNQPVDGVYMVETWLVEDELKDKSKLYGFEPKKGDWYGMFKVDNKEIWADYIKTGKVKGVSLEGYFIENLMSK